MKRKMLSLVMALLMVLLCACNAVEDVSENTDRTETTTEVMETEIEIEIAEEVIETQEKTVEPVRTIFDDVDYPFVLDKNVLGRWESCGYVDTIEDFPDNQYDIIPYLENIIFTGIGKCFLVFSDAEIINNWTQNMVLDKTKLLNSEYTIKTIDGTEYLFVQWKSGDYYMRGVEPKYYVFIRNDEPRFLVNKFDDLREYLYLQKSEYDFEDIVTYSYQSNMTSFIGLEDYAGDILEKGKDPGLGIRDLHEQGITGKGVNVAIIDQNLVTTQYHPEYDGKIAEYYDTGTEQRENSGSMHGPAVLSLLVGETVGVAPDAKVYYAAMPSWKGDSQYYADALYWIIEENKNLPDNEKIRVVSISAEPSGNGSPFTYNQESYIEAVTAAHAEGILVLDCRYDESTGFIIPMYGEIDNRDDFDTYKVGFPTSPSSTPINGIYVPTSLRTSAGQYSPDDSHYTYWGSGGLSWGIPYAAGVLALGWQVDPSLTKDEIVQILFDTCYVNQDGANIINPPAFIEYIQTNANK